MGEGEALGWRLPEGEVVAVSEASDSEALGETLTLTQLLGLRLVRALGVSEGLPEGLPEGLGEAL